MNTRASTGNLGGLLLAALGLAVAVPAFASPMKYSATLVTDIKVGEHSYHNAAVTFTTYTVGPLLGFFITGTLSVCAGPASRGLSTDHGGFFLQDQVGGSMTPPNPFGWGGWGASNTGSLQIEVMTADQD